MTTIAEILASRLTQVQADLVKYRAARDALLVGGQSVSIGPRSLTRADLAAIEKQIEKLEAKELSLVGGNKIVGQQIVVRD